MSLIIPPPVPQLPYAGQSVKARDLRDIWRGLSDVGTPLGDVGDESWRGTGTLGLFVLVSQGPAGTGVLYGKDPDDQQGTPVEFEIVMPPTLYEASRGAVTYTYTDANNRTATDGGTNETHKLTPEYLVADLLLCAYVESFWLDLNIDGRQWASV